MRDRKREKRGKGNSAPLAPFFFFFCFYQTLPEKGPLAARARSLSLSLSLALSPSQFAVIIPSGQFDTRFHTSWWGYSWLARADRVSPRPAPTAWAYSSGRWMQQAVSQRACLRAGLLN